jgi:hypothetical protein
MRPTDAPPADDSAAPPDYLARLPLTVDRTPHAIRIFPDASLAGDAAHQVNGAIAAIVAMAVEADRAAREDNPYADEDDGDDEDEDPADDAGAWPDAYRRLTARGPAEPDAPPAAGASWAARVALALMADLDDEMAVREVAKAVAGMVRAGKLDFLAYAERADEMTRERHAAVAKAAKDVSPC